jgi:hypothetical protein
MKTLLFVGTALVAGALSLASPAGAVTVTWNTCDGDGGLNDCEISVPGPDNDFSLVESPRVHSDPPGSNNNSIEFTENVDGIDRKLTATAHRGDTDAGGTTTTAILPAEISIFEGGLGVHWEIDGAPDESTGSPDHAVDNIGFDELVLFEFADADYEPISFMTGWSCGFGGDGDGDCEYDGTNDILAFIGGDGILGAFLSYFQTGVALAGFTAELFDDVPIGESQFFSQGGTGKFMIIASTAAVHAETSVSQVTASDSDPSGPGTGIPSAFTGSSTSRANYCSSTFAASNRSHFDSQFVGSKWKCKWKETTTVMKDGGGAFKIVQIVGELVDEEVPAPMTVALLGSGLVGLGTVARRRRAA